MDQIVRFLGESPQEFSQDVLQNANHHVLGNKSLQRFDGTIKLSESWRQSLSRIDQKRMMEWTQPVSKEFGYDEMP